MDKGGGMVIAIFRDGTGIHNHNVRRFLKINHPVTIAVKAILNDRRFRLIQPAAEGIKGNRNFIDFLNHII